MHVYVISSTAKSVDIANGNPWEVRGTTVISAMMRLSWWMTTVLMVWLSASLSLQTLSNFPYQKCTRKKKEHFSLGIVELISFLPKSEFKDQFNSWVTYLEDKLLFCRDRTCADVVAGVVTKCLNARPKTKDGGIAVCLMFVEIEQQAVVQVWLLTALSFACMPIHVSVSELMQRILL